VLQGRPLKRRPVLPIRPPPELAAFWKLTRGYSTWSSFTELRLDASLLGRFDADENVFELCVLNDQLNYLGTALSEAFSAAVCFATYGDGDSWHLDINPTDADDPHHVVTRYSHDDHAFEQEPVANSLHHAVFLSAVVHAFRQEWLTKEQAKALLSTTSCVSLPAVRSLRSRSADCSIYARRSWLASCTGGCGGLS
jgi:hypothetical protein